MAIALKVIPSNDIQSGQMISPASALSSYMCQQLRGTLRPGQSTPQRLAVRPDKAMRSQNAEANLRRGAFRKNHECGGCIRSNEAICRGAR
jgi:hypothetical protein